MWSLHIDIISTTAPIIDWMLRLRGATVVNLAVNFTICGGIFQKIYQPAGVVILFRFTYSLTR